MPKPRSQRRKNRGNRAGRGQRKGKKSGALLPRVRQPGFETKIDNRLNNVFRLQHRCRLRYFDTLDLGVVGASPVAYVFSANGLFDPDVTGTGHQPMGFDQLSAFYQHHTVMNSSVTVGFANMDAATFVNAAVAVQRSSSTLGSYPRLIEAGNVVHGYMGGISGGGGPPPMTLKQAVNIAKWQGVPNPLDDSTLRGTPSANPTTGVYFVLYAVGPVTTTTQHLFVNVQLEYDAIFTEPFQPIQS